ncbi:MAG TPA: hypothetical protein VLL08_05695 [Kineosporiaceae bacterium]|nr:hypothetical protein [Kineosporiaceae bacterium]
MSVHQEYLRREEPRTRPLSRPVDGWSGRKPHDARSLIALQRSAGNAAVSAALASRPRAVPVVQRCGDQPCDCADDERVASAGIEPKIAAQREAESLGSTSVEAEGPIGAAETKTPITTAALVTGSMTPGASLSTSGGQRLCFPPAAFTDPQFGSGFGTIAERLIEQDYCATLGCSPATTFVDNFNPTQYKDFLTAHNPGLGSGAKALALAVASATGIARPDLMCDDGVRKDYYEIKPLSPSGVGAGMTKLVEIAAFMAALGLPYVPGTTYSPSKDIPMMSGLILGEPLTVSLNVQRFTAGLVTYSLCLEGNLAQILAKVALATLLAWIAAELLMMAGGILVLA